MPTLLIMRSAAITLTALWLVVACGGDGSPRESPGVGGNAGAPADGGSAGMAVGGSGGMTAGTGGDGGSNIPRGAVSLHVLSPPGCSLEEHYQDFPEVASGHPVSGTERVESVADGDVTADGEPVTVICDWFGLDSPYPFRGRIKIGSVADRMVELGGPLVQGETTIGNLILIDPDLPAQYGGKGSCHYDVLSLDETTGSIWGRVTCDVLSPTEGIDTCAVGPSFFFFENCTPPT